MRNNKLTFNWIKIKGFCSVVEPLFYDLQRPGLTILQAENGVGKTTIFSGLSWVIYGKTLKKKNTVEPWDKVKTKDYKGTMVSLNLTRGEDTYTIIRCHKYKGKAWEDLRGGSNLFIIQNGKLLNLKNKNQTRDKAASIIGCSFEMFKNSILFGQKLKRLINESGPDKQKILEEIFETEYLTRARKIAAEENKKVSQELDLRKVSASSEQAVCTLLQNKYESLKKQASKAKEAIALKEKKQAEYPGWVENLNKYRALSKNLGTYKLKIEGKIERIDARMNEIDIKKQKYREVEYQAIFKKQLITDIREDIRRLNSENNLICKTCGRPLESKAEIEKLKANRATSIKNYLKEAKDIKKELNELLKLKSELYKYASSEKLLNKLIIRRSKLTTKLQGREKELKQQVQFYESKIEGYRELKKNLSQMSVPTKAQIAQSKEAYLEKKKVLKSLEEQVTELTREKSTLEWIIKDPLSNKGIKAFLFKEQIERVNSFLDVYSSILGFRTRLEVSPATTREPVRCVIERAEQEVSYDELSGGEQQLTDIALAFSIHDTRDEVLNCNLLLMDELFESLSKKNVELVQSLLEKKARNKSLHFITHLESVSAFNAHIIKLSNIRGRTELLKP